MFLFWHISSTASLTFEMKNLIVFRFNDFMISCISTFDEIVVNFKMCISKVNSCFRILCASHPIVCCGINCNIVKCAPIAIVVRHPMFSTICCCKIKISAVNILAKKSIFLLFPDIPYFTVICLDKFIIIHFRMSIIRASIVYL